MSTRLLLLPFQSTLSTRNTQHLIPVEAPALAGLGFVSAVPLPGTVLLVSLLPGQLLQVFRSQIRYPYLPGVFPSVIKIGFNRPAQRSSIASSYQSPNAVPLLFTWAHSPVRRVDCKILEGRNHP